jgi:hypothetical protein
MRGPARWTARLEGRAAEAASSFPVSISVRDGAGLVATETLTVTVQPEVVQLQPTGATALTVDGADGDVDQLQVPFTVTEDPDGSPSSELAGSDGTRGAAPVTVSATDQGGRSFQCVDAALDGGANGAVTGSCALQDVPAGIYELRLAVDNGRFKGDGTGVVTVEGSRAGKSKKHVLGAGKVKLGERRSARFGVRAWTSRDHGASGHLVVHGLGPDCVWKLRSTDITGIRTGRGPGSRIAEVTADAILEQRGRRGRLVEVKLYVEDRWMWFLDPDRAWIGVYDRSGRLLRDYSSTGSPPSDARPVRGDVKVGVR